MSAIESAILRLISSGNSSATIFQLQKWNVGILLLFAGSIEIQLFVSLETNAQSRVTLVINWSTAIITFPMVSELVLPATLQKNSRVV